MRRAQVKTKRVYEPVAKADGTRVLIMRYWPRGIRKEKVDIWLRELAPIIPLLRAFLDGKITWAQYRPRYRACLKRPEAQAAGSDCHLAAGLFTRCEEAGVPGIRQTRRQLEEKGRLARAGRPREEHHRAGDESAAEDAIDRGEPGPDPGLLELGGQVEDGRLAPRADRPQRAPRRMLADRSPFAARRAPARPLGGRSVTGRADEEPLDLAHARTVARGCDTL